MTSPTVSRPPQTPEEVENAIIVAGLALQCARNPGETRAAYQRLVELKRLRDELRKGRAA